MPGVARHRCLDVLAALLLLAPGTACPPTPQPRPPVQLSLQLATRQSCGILSGLDYETSCLAAMYVRVLDETRTQIHEECHVLSEPPAERPGELREILRGSPLLRFGGLSTTGVVTFEVRGLHDVELEDGETPATLCERPARTDRWLFWGESEPVDLGALDDKEGAVVQIVMDCRDCTFACGEQECFGCPGIGQSQCSAAFPSSFCVPTAGCDKTCEEDEDCFEGARACDDDRCNTTQVTGGLCSPCGGDGAGCAEGLTCVARAANQPGFCAPPCPDEICASGTRCNRLGNDLVLKN